MERLTVSYYDGTVGFCAEEDSLECENILKDCYDCKHHQKMMAKLADYEDKEEQGLLIELPCKVGDNLYQIGEGYYQVSSNITEYAVTAFTISLKGVQICVKNGDLGFVVNSDSIGKRFFLTRSEAEEALAKMGGK